MNPESDISVQVTRHLRAAPERVFDAWLDPALLGHWMFGPEVRDEQIVRLQMDARVGGTFSFVVRRGGDEIDHIGRYLVIERPRRLVFTWAARDFNDDEVGDDAQDSSRVSIIIEPRDTGCELSLTHALAAEWAEYTDRTRAGWSSMLDALQRTLDA